VSGEARSSAGTLNAAVRLVDNRSSVILWSREFSGPSVEVEALRQRMAIRIAEVLVCALGTRARRPSNIDLATLRLFLAGCENSHTDWPAAREYLGQAVQRRPNFTQARAMYAMATYLNTGGSSTAPADVQQRLLREAAIEARKVLEDDTRAGEAYAALSGALYNSGSWSGPAGFDIWHKRLDLLRKGIAADPDCFALHTALAVVLGNTGLKRDELPHLERAVALDPFAPIGAGNLAEVYAFNGRLAEANRILDQAGRYWPNEFYTGWVRFNVAARVGDPMQAIAMLDDPQRNPASSPPRIDLWRLFLRARADPSPGNVERVRVAIATAEPGESDQRVKVEMIQHLTQLGALDDAFRIALAMPSVSRDFGFTWFADYMKPFRADPRFLELARRQGLHGIWARSKRWPDFCSDEQLPYSCQ
jgi:tetratricopeptide (TPR) repeat protein